MMGSPELPQDDQNDFDASAVNSVIVDDMDNGSEASDESDNEPMDYDYAGYQPLPGDDELNTTPMIADDDRVDEQQVFCQLIFKLIKYILINAPILFESRIRDNRNIFQRFPIDSPNSKRVCGMHPGRKHRQLN